jgi:hypothetical protein
MRRVATGAEVGGIKPRLCLHAKYRHRMAETPWRLGACLRLERLVGAADAPLECVTEPPKCLILKKIEKDARS